MLNEAIRTSPIDAPVSPGEELEALYRSWRILDLVGETVDSMPPEWLQVLNIARNLAMGRDIPGVDVPDELRALVASQPDVYTTVTHTERRRRVVDPLRGDTTVQPLRDISDLPRATLPDLMLRDIDPELFEFQLVSGGINGVYTRDLAPAVEEYDEIIEERVPVPAHRKRKRQEVYALLDVSNSMRDHNKAIFARALMLAYLLSACDERAHIYFRSFANTVHERTDCSEPGGFAEVARRILRISPDGSTDIRRAIITAIEDIKALGHTPGSPQGFAAKGTEILLISDCESYSVPFVPAGIKLHTVHLDKGWMQRGYQEGFERIREQSKTFHQIDTSNLVMPATTRERWLLRQDMTPQDDDAPVAAGDDEPGQSGAVTRSAVHAAYARMATADTRQGGRVSFGGTGGLVQPAAVNPFRIMWRMLKQVCHVPHRAPRHANNAGAIAASGVQFRLRR